MRKIMMWSLLAFVAAASSAQALTVKENEVVNKIRAVSLQEVRLNGQAVRVLADAQGLSAYTFDRDTEGKSSCEGACLRVWPPLRPLAGESLVAPFGQILGNDGQPQLTVLGLPLYYHQKDKKPGDTNGQYPGWQLVLVSP